MKRLVSLFTIILFILIVINVWAFSIAPPPTDEAVLRQGESVVYGVFTGKSYTEIKHYKNMLDDEGMPVNYNEVITILEFEVLETLDGAKMDDLIEICVVGGVNRKLSTPMAVDIKNAKGPVILSLEPDSDGGYIIVHGRILHLPQNTSIGEMRQKIKASRSSYRSSNEVMEDIMLQSQDR